MFSASLLLIALLVLALLIYQIRILRRINAKLTKLVAPDRDIRRIAKEIEKASRENYRQSEFYSQLLRLLDLSAPVPSTRSWAASPDVLLTLLEHAQESNLHTILDLGSGISTLVLAKSAPSAKVISIDHSAEFARKTREMLSLHGVTNAEVRIAPLIAHTSGVDWYDTSQLYDVRDIDLLFIDGPPGSKNNRARHPALTECISKLNPRAIIVIDDAGRDGERDLANEFAKKLPSHTLEFLSHEKGTAVLLPR